MELLFKCKSINFLMLCPNQHLIRSSLVGKEMVYLESTASLEIVIAGILNFDEMSQTISVGAFWDIENLRVPKLSSTCSVCSNLSNNFIPENGCLQMFYTAVNIQEEVSSRGFGQLQQWTEILDTPRIKNGADVQLIGKMLEYSVSTPKPSDIVLISDDGGYRGCMETLKKRGHKVIVVHSCNVSHMLLTVADEEYLFNDAIKGLQRQTVRLKGIKFCLGLTKDFSKMFLQPPFNTVGMWVLNFGGDDVELFVTFWSFETAYKFIAKFSGKHLFGFCFQATMVKSDSPIFRRYLKQIKPAHKKTK